MFRLMHLLQVDGILLMQVFTLLNRKLAPPSPLNQRFRRECGAIFCSSSVSFPIRCSLKRSYYIGLLFLLMISKTACSAD